VWREKNMRRIGLALTAALALTVLLVPQSAIADKPLRTCPPGFDLGALTLEQGLQLPNIQAALADGVIDVATLTVLFEGFDANDDGLICFQSYPTSSNPVTQQQYAYNVVDNNASVPSG
jgi:hypothetical protein